MSLPPASSVEGGVHFSPVPVVISQMGNGDSSPTDTVKTKYFKSSRIKNFAKIWKTSYVDYKTNRLGLV